jgi:LacI family transcriptional regulator
LRKCSSVICDNREAARKAVQHLIDHGRKRILCLGGDPRLYTIRERVKGYTSAVVSAGLASLVDMEAADYPSAERIVLKRIAQDSGIDAVFGLYNQSTIHTYEVLRNHRIPLPKRISIVGFDDFSLASTVRPSITVVRQGVKEIAMAATQLLFDHIGGEAGAPRQIEIGSTLIIRQSCGCPAQQKH